IGDDAGCPEAPYELLGLPNREILLDDRRQDLGLMLDLEPSEGSTVTFGEPAIGHRGLDRVMEVEQAKRVGHGRARPTDAKREVLLAEAELVDQLSIGPSGFEGVEILALEVLHEGK